MASDETPDAVADDRAYRTPPADGSAGASGLREPERKCILSGAHAGRAELIRLALGPDGAVWPDLAGKLPGRGAWIAPDRAALETGMAKGKLKGALARAFKGPATVPDDLADKIAAGLERRALDRLGLEHRAGHLIFGSDKLSEWARAGRLHLLLHASDAAEDGRSKLDQAFRSGGGGMQQVIQLPAGRDALSRALGRENMVHSGVSDAKAATRIATEVARWSQYLGSQFLGSGILGASKPMDDGRDPPGRRNDEGRE